MSTLSGTLTRSKLTRITIGSLAAIAILIYLVWMLFLTPNPDRSAANLANLIENRDWGAIYDMGSDLDKSAQGFSREQFVKLVNGLTTQYPSNLGTVRCTGDWQKQTTWKYFVFKV